MKIAVLTFHAAHNFGSVLQTYALQEKVKNLFLSINKPIEYDVINFRTKYQKNMYNVFLKNNGLKPIIKNVLRIPYTLKYKTKHRKFEDFIKDDLHTTHEISNDEELTTLEKKYDCIICGSDQIWNIRAGDFSWNYLLPNYDGKKVSYAASLGPMDIDWSKYDSAKYQSLVQKFDMISVREQKSSDNLMALKQLNCQINVDPTLLLSADEWRKISSNKNYKNGEYILLYCLEPTKTQLKMVHKISKELGLPVVATKYNNKNDYFNSFIKFYDCGPKDFLSLIDNAKYVITSSFHGTAFSIIFKKQFFVLDGMQDNRISNLLKITNLQDRSISSETITFDADEFGEIDYKYAEMQIEKEVKRSEEYLLKIAK